MFRVDEFRESLYALVGEYDVSRGSSASVLSVVCESIRIGVVESRHYPFVEFGREGISVYHLFPGDAKDSVGILVDFPYAGCLRKVTRVGRELRLGVRAKPRGFGADDAWDPDDDKWVIIKFPARGWSAWYRIFFFARRNPTPISFAGWSRTRHPPNPRSSPAEWWWATRPSCRACAWEARRTFLARSDRLFLRDRK